MCWIVKVFAPAMILPAFLWPGFAEQAPNSTKAKRSVEVNVVDVHGDTVRDLAKQNFRLRLNGKPVEVLDARYTFATRRIVVLLDMSGSMTEEAGSAKWRIAHEAVADLLTATPTDMPIAMLTFTSNVRDTFDFSSSRSVIMNWLSKGPGQQPKLKFPARTALLDAILAGLRFLSPIQSGDAVYLITDGGDNVSQATLVQTEAALLDSGARLFALLFDVPLPAPDDDTIAVAQERDGQDSLRKIVEDSGGSVFTIPGLRRQHRRDFEYTYDKENRAKLKVYTKELNDQVNRFWTLELAEPSTNKESRITVEVVDHEGRRKDVGVTYPRMLSAPK